VNPNLAKVGGWCALLLVACFAAGIAMMASSGVQVLIPETGDDGLTWLADADHGGNLFVAGAVSVVFGGLLAIGAFLGLHHALKSAGSLVLVATVAGIAGMVLVTVSHATPIALAKHLAPAYLSATGSERASLAATQDTWASFCLLMNYFGDALAWGVTTPIYAVAALRLKVAPRAIGWIGLVSAVFAGWIGLFSPLSGAIDAITTIGFFAFFIFVAGLGVALVRRGDRVGAAAVAAAP
jgi:hypothetical protein